MAKQSESTQPESAHHDANQNVSNCPDSSPGLPAKPATDHHYSVMLSSDPDSPEAGGFDIKDNGWGLTIEGWEELFLEHMKDIAERSSREANSIQRRK